MKYRKLTDLLADKNITPEDVAQFALFERDMLDSDKFKALCDLILCCERVAVAELESKLQKFREGLERIANINWNNKQYFGTTPTMMHRAALEIAKQTLKETE